MPKVRWTVKRHHVLGKTAHYSNSWFQVFVFQTAVGVWIFNELRSRSWCNGRRKGSGEALTPLRVLKFDTFQESFSKKCCDFSFKWETRNFTISNPLEKFTVGTPWKKCLRRPWRVSLLSEREQESKTDSDHLDKVTISELWRVTEAINRYCDQYSFRSHFVQLNMSRCPDITHYGLCKWEANICFSWDVILTLISRTPEFQKLCILCGHLRFPFISSITKITENNVLLTFRPRTEYFSLALRLKTRNVRNCQRHQQQ